LGLALGWQFEGIPGSFEDHATQISDQTGRAITNMEPAKRGMRAYFDVDDINAAAARVKEFDGERTSRARCRAWGGSQSVRIPRAMTSASGRTTPLSQFQLG
jgi:predicted enzyme related to lactoylglutathione lyase